MSYAVVIHHLKKIYKGSEKEVIKDISLSIPKGQFIGILGPNGAGKSTMIHCLTGVARISGGSIHVCGHDVVSDYRKARKEIGFSPQEFTVDIFDSIDNMLDYQAGFFGITGDVMQKRREEMIQQFDLQQHRKKKFQTLSGGLKRRAVLAKAMMHHPKVLILDEPTAGVDVETRQTLWKFLRDLHANGTTIILTSHYLEEVQALCERVALIKDGEIILDGFMKDLTKEKSLEEIYLTSIEHTKTI